MWESYHQNACLCVLHFLCHSVHNQDPPRANGRGMEDTPAFTNTMGPLPLWANSVALVEQFDVHNNAMTGLTGLTDLGVWGLGEFRGSDDGRVGIM